MRLAVFLNVSAWQFGQMSLGSGEYTQVQDVPYKAVMTSTHLFRKEVGHVEVAADPNRTHVAHRAPCVFCRRSSSTRRPPTR